MKRFLILILVIISFYLLPQSIKDSDEWSFVIWRDNIPEDLTPKNVYKYLVRCEIFAVDVVFRQVIHETGELTSRLCREENNLFGMYAPLRRETTATRTPNGYARFENWKQAIIDYKLLQEYYLDKGKDMTDYYSFLKSIGYAEDSLYIPKLKRIDLTKYDL